MSRVEEVALRLAVIRDELMALGDNPSTERYQLLTEQDSLRAEAGGFAEQSESERPTEHLEAELVALRGRRKGIVRSRSGYVMGKGGNSAGPASGAWVGLSKQSRSAAGLDRINVRISHLEDVLASRRGRNTWDTTSK